MDNDGEDYILGVLFPLPFRVLVLIGVGILAWATNLHGLNLLRVDVVAAMNMRVEGQLQLPLRRRPSGFRNIIDSAFLYRAAYHLFLVYSVWCAASWLLFRFLTYDNPLLVDVYGYIPGFSALCMLFALICPLDVLQKQERTKFLQAVSRCIFPAGTVYFADVVLADVFTSFAKVLGDVWLSSLMLLPGNSMLRPPSEGPWLRWILPTVMSVPYLIRLRQCIVEYQLPTCTSRKPLYNAVKYATSFPVIYLSAAQRLFALDLAQKSGDPITRHSWHGEDGLFRLWLLAAAVNSLYSFWWDVTNDWGLDLLVSSKSETIQETFASPAPRRLLLPRLHSVSTSRSNSPDHDREIPLSGTITPRRDREGPSLLNVPLSARFVPLPLSAGTRGYPSGLRPTLLYPLPFYPIIIFLNLILRLTWSIKLSSHLHIKADGSHAIFWVEVAEIIRRWMWVFLRVEWELIKKSHEGTARLFPDDPLRSGDSSDYEMVPNSPEYSDT